MPSEDLKSRKICCNLTLVNSIGKGGNIGCAKVTFGGDRGIRTPDLCDANAALSRLSYIPITLVIITHTETFIKRDYLSLS